MPKKPILHVTKRPNGMYKIEMKGDGVLLYKTQEEMDKLFKLNQYHIVFDCEE
jgi:hypothetical protein